MNLLEELDLKKISEKYVKIARKILLFFYIYCKIIQL